MKIDAEGFDVKVLAGASELFGQTEVFLVELRLQRLLEFGCACGAVYVRGGMQYGCN